MKRTYTAEELHAKIAPGEVRMADTGWSAVVHDADLPDYARTVVELPRRRPSRLACWSATVLLLAGWILLWSAFVILALWFCRHR